MSCRIGYIDKQQLSETDKQRLFDAHVDIFTKAKKSGAFRAYNDRLYTRKNSYDRAVNFVANINKEEGAKVAILQTSQPGQHFLSVNVLPLANIQATIGYEQRGSRQQELTPLLTQPEAVGEDPVQQKIANLKGTFRKIGIKVEIEVDPDLTVNGEVTYTGKDKATIKLSPRIFDDSIEHEFAHIYIDLLPQGIRDLLWREIEHSGKDIIAYVEKTYPDINRGSERFKKECMAWVVGEAASKETPKKLSKLQVIINRIFRYIGSLFSKSPGWGKQLAQEMISGQLVVRNKAELPTGQKSEQRNITASEFRSRFIIDLEAKLKELAATGLRKGGEGTAKVFNNLLVALQNQNDLESLRLIAASSKDFIDKANGILAKGKTSRAYSPGFIRHTMDFIDLYDGIRDVYLGRDVDEKIREEVNSKLWRSNETGLNDIRKLLLQRIKESLLETYSSLATNKEYVDEMEKILDAEKDWSNLGRFFAPEYEAPLALFQLQDKYIKLAINKGRLQAERYLEQLEELYKGLKTNGWEWLHEKNSKGEKTGRYWQEFSPEYYDRVQELSDKIHAFRSSKLPEHQIVADQLEKERKDFFHSNTHQEYNAEYYAIYDILNRNPKAREQREAINRGIQFLRNKAHVVGDEFRPEALSPEDYDQLIHLQEAKDNLSSLIDPETGLPKTGEEREVAEIVREFNKKISEVYEGKLLDRRRRDFEEAKQAARLQGDEYYAKWLIINSKREISPVYYDKLEEAFKLLEGADKSEISQINEKIRELASDYKMKGGFIRGRILSKRNPELFKQISELERKKEKILKEKSLNSSHFLRAFEIPEELDKAPNKTYFDKIEEARGKLTPVAKKWKDDFKAAIYSVLAKYAKEGSKIFNSYEVSPDDLAILIELQRVYNGQIGYGLKKEQLTKDQLSVRDYNEILGKISDWIDNKELRDKFQEDEGKAKDQGEDYYNLWKEWFEKEKTVYNEANEAVGAIIGYQVSVPLNEYVDVNKTKAYRELNKLSVRVNSPEYEQALQEAKTGSESDFNKWYKANHYFDPIAGKQVPFIIWTQTVPRDESYIENEAPSNFWRESKVKDEYRNPEWEANKDPNTGFGKPLGKWKSRQWERIMSLPDDDIKKRTLLWLTNTIKDITDDMGESILNKGFYPTHYKGNDKTLLEQLGNIPSQVWRTHESEFEKYELRPGLRLRMPFVQILQHEYVKKDRITGEVTDSPEEVLRKTIANRKFHREHINYDVHSMLQDFIPSMLRYKMKNQILDEMILTERLFLSDAKIPNKDKRQLLSRKTMGATGMTEAPYRFVDPEESRLYERFKDYMSMTFYEEGLVPWHSRPNEKGMVIDYNKIAQSLNRYTQLKALAFNIYGAVSNVTLGQVQLKIEAASKQFFGNRNLRAGNKFYFKELPLLIADSFSPTKRSLPGKLMKLFSFEINKDMVDRFGGFDQNGLISNSLMFVYKSGDFMLQSVQAFAMLDANTIVNGKVVRITDPKTQKSLLTQFKELQEANPSITPTQLLDRVGMSEKEFSTLKGKIEIVFNRNNGIYNATDKAAIQKYAIGSMAMVFRKFIQQGFERRYERKRYIEQGEAEFMGYYRATWQFIGQIYKDLAKLRMALIKTKWEELPEYQKAGIRATLTEVSILLASILLVMLISGAFGGDDDKETKLEGFARYQLERLRADILFFTPAGFVTGDVWKILRSPLVTMSTLEDVGQFFGSIAAYPFQQVEDRVMKTGKDKGTLKVWKNTRDLIPVYNQIVRLQDPSKIADYYRIWQ